MKKRIIKKFVQKIFLEMEETDKAISIQEREVKRRIRERKDILKQGIRYKKEF